MFKFNNKDTASVSIANFEHLIGGWVIKFAFQELQVPSNLFLYFTNSISDLKIFCECSGKESP